MRDTETIDRLFLELSQFTTATTAKELKLGDQLDDANLELAQIRRLVVQTGLTEDEGSVMGMVQSICELAIARSNMAKALNVKAKP